MEVIFVRHKLSSTPTILKELWDNKLIALHYQDIPSTNPKDYGKEGQHALQRLWDYCSEGVISCATYRKIKPTKILIGQIEKGSKIVSKKFGQYIFKTVRLKSTIEIAYKDYPLLSAIQPIGGTISKWPSASKHIQAIYNGEELGWNVDSLHPSQLEVLCYEYLASNGVVSHQIMPIGRTMLDIDIYCIGPDRKTVLAQVTNSDNQEVITKKITKLLAYKSPDTRLIFFGPRKFAKKLLDAKYVPIQKVFAYFAESNISSSKYLLISKMLNSS